MILILKSKSCPSLATPTSHASSPASSSFCTNQRSLLRSEPYQPTGSPASPLLTLLKMSNFFPAPHRVALLQLHSSFSLALSDNLHRVSRVPSSACSEYGDPNHSVLHLLSCPASPRTSIVVDLWTSQVHSFHLFSSLLLSSLPPPPRRIGKHESNSTTTGIPSRKYP